MCVGVFSIEIQTIEQGKGGSSRRKAVKWVAEHSQFSGPQIWILWPIL